MVQTACLRPLQVVSCAFTQSVLLIVSSERWYLYSIGDLRLLLAVPCVNPLGWSGGGFLHTNVLIMYSKDGAAYVYALADHPDVTQYLSPSLPTLTLFPHDAYPLNHIPLSSSLRFSCRMVVSDVVGVPLSGSSWWNQVGAGLGKALMTPQHSLKVHHVLFGRVRVGGGKEDDHHHR